MTTPHVAPAVNNSSAVQPKKPKISSTDGPTKKTSNKGSTQMPQKPSLSQTVQPKKVPRRSSKPIINWFQRKWAASGKAKRTENHPLASSQFGIGRSNSNSNRQMGRIASSPLPVPVVHQLKQQNKTDAAPHVKRKTRSISLNRDDDRRQSYAVEDDVSDEFSLNRDSIWSPASAFEADEDASVRPLPPSSPPSPSPSRDSSSCLSDPRTFRSMAASTKPTTLRSIDLNGGGMAHIAQVPAAQPHRFTPHARQSSFGTTGVPNNGGSVTFSAVPNPAPPSSLHIPGSLSSTNDNNISTVQAPLHSTPHPRNNPRPSSPPLDNASVLTLASSAFALPNRAGIVNYPHSVTVGDSVSHYGGSIVFPDGESTSQFVLGDDERLEERDIDASVRALRPRSSRRGSWESEASRWSARVQGAGTSLHKGGLRASGSIRTGAFNTENAEAFETNDGGTAETATREIESEKELVCEPEASLDNPIAAVDTPSKDEPKHEVENEDVSISLASDKDAQQSKDSQVLHRSSTDTIGQAAILAGDGPAKEFFLQE